MRSTDIGVPRNFSSNILPGVMLSFLLFPALFSCSQRTVDSAFVANAGKDSRTLVGKPVTLDGSNSKDLKGRHFDYVWTFSKRPSGSRAVLKNDRTSGPTFTPDSAGRFVVQLQITDGTFNSEAAAATVDADYPPAAFLSVETWVQFASTQKASDYGLKLGQATPDGTLINDYRATDFTGTYASDAPVGFLLLVLNKSDGTVVDGYPKTFPMITASPDATNLQTELQNLGNGMDKIVILTSLANATKFAWDSTCSTCAGLIKALEGIGASSDVMSLSTAEGYSLIGTNGFISGASSQTNASTGYEYYSSKHFNTKANSADIAGYFIRDPFQNFRFSYDYLPFETVHEQTSDGDTTTVNSIVIGSTVYQPPTTAVIDSSKNGGFHVLILQRDTLAKVLQDFYQVYSNGAANGTEMKRMGDSLYNTSSATAYPGLPWNDQYIVIISALGALPNIWNSFKTDNYAYLTESVVDILGGTPGLFRQLTTGSTYSLVGIGPGTGYKDSTKNSNYSGALYYTRTPDTNFPITGAEASSILSPGSPANIRGLLKKDRLGFYAPVMWDGGGIKTWVDYTIPPLSLQAPSAWRGPDTAKETQVYQDMGKLLLYGLADIPHPEDLRQYYFRTDFSWPDRLITISTLTCQQLAGAQNITGDSTLDCNDSDTLNAFSTMKSYLSEEIMFRDDLQSWFYTDLRELLDGIENNQVISLQTDYKNALTLTKVDQTTDIVMDIHTILSDILGSVSSLLFLMGAPVPLPGDHDGIAPHVSGFSDKTKSSLNRAAAGIGLFSSISTLAGDIAHIADPDWGATQVNTMPGKVKAAASEAFTQLVAQYINNRAILDQTFMFMTTDWDKLEALHATYSDIYQKSEYMNVLAAMRPGTDVYFYKVLLPVIFHAEPMPYVVCASIDGSGNGNPCGFFVCDSGSGKHNQDEKCPFTSSAGYYRPSNAMYGFDTLWYTSNTCAGSYNRSSYYTVWKSNSTSTGDYYDDTNIKLFQSVSAGGLGVQQVNFATRWPFQFVWPTSWSGGCNCSPETTICK